MGKLRSALIVDPLWRARFHDVVSIEQQTNISELREVLQDGEVDETKIKLLLEKASNSNLTPAVIIHLWDSLIKTRSVNNGIL